MKIGGYLHGAERLLRAALSHPPLVGVLMVVTVHVCIRPPRRDGSDDGIVDTLILAGVVLCGLIVGLVADILVRARRGRAATFGALPSPIEVLCVSLALWLLGFWWAMATTPHLYEKHFYAKGGMPRTVQILATDLLGPPGVVAVFLGLLFAYVGPRRILALVRAVALGAVRRPVLALAWAALPVAWVVLGRFDLGVEKVSKPRRGDDAPSRSARPNILLVVIDSLRADRWNSRTTPNLVRLAARGVRFDRAYVSSVDSSTSWMTLLTGVHRHHRPRDVGARQDPSTLAMLLRGRGYRIAALSDRPENVFGGVNFGFERVLAPPLDLTARLVVERAPALLPLFDSPLGRSLIPTMNGVTPVSPARVEKAAAAALRGMKPGPFFLTVSLSTLETCASPYPYYAQYAELRYRGRFKYDATGAKPEDTPDANDATQLVALYDGAVRAIDETIRLLVDSLEHEELAANTVVVVTSVRGKRLFESVRGAALPGAFLDEDAKALAHFPHEPVDDSLFGDELTHVPMLIMAPGIADGGTSVESIVRDVDLVPTICEIAGASCPSATDGRSLAGQLRGSPSEVRFAYAETSPRTSHARDEAVKSRHRQGAGQAPGGQHDSGWELGAVLQRRMIRDERFKLVYVPTRKGAKYILFDTALDVAETEDVAGAHPEIAAALQHRLWAWMLEDSAMELRDGLLLPRQRLHPAPLHPVEEAR